MKIKNVIQRIQSAYSKGVQSDDTRLSSRHIYNKILSVRSKLISQKAKKNQKISDWNFSILPCVEVIEVDAHSCPCLPQVGCKVYRTKYPLPKPLLDYDTYLIDWIRSVEKSLVYNETTRNEESYIRGRKYTNKTRRYIIEGNYIFFYGISPGSSVAIKFISGDPIEVYNYPSICPQSVLEPNCLSPLDLDLPMDEEMIDDLILMCQQEVVGIFNQSNEDSSNNTRDNPLEQTK